ncbi:hypothetical protein [Bradyrhizobium sp. LB13.1]
MAEACRLDLNKPTDKKRAAYLLKVWVGTGALKRKPGKTIAATIGPYRRGGLGDMIRLEASPRSASFGISLSRPKIPLMPGLPGFPPVTMADPTDETGEEQREVTSDLRHDIGERPADDKPGSVVDERRGIRRATWDKASATGQPDAEGTFGVMTIAANRHLRAVGEMDLTAVMETAENLSAQYPSPEKISEHLRLWVQKLKTQKGELSIDTTAARFLQAADRLLQILDQSPEMQSAAFDFADAWHWWHLELYGEHALAAKADTAERAVAGLQAGPEALKRNRALREAIIESEYNRYAATADIADSGSAKRAAAAILSAVSTAFDQRSLGPIKESTLERTLRSIIKDRGQVHDR